MELSMCPAITASRRYLAPVAVCASFLRQLLHAHDLGRRLWFSCQSQLRLFHFWKRGGLHHDVNIAGDFDIAKANETKEVLRRKTGTQQFYWFKRSPIRVSRIERQSCLEFPGRCADRCAYQTPRRYFCTCTSFTSYNLSCNATGYWWHFRKCKILLLYIQIDSWNSEMNRKPPDGCTNLPFPDWGARFATFSLWRTWCDSVLIAAEQFFRTCIHAYSVRILYKSEATLGGYFASPVNRAFSAKLYS